MNCWTEKKVGEINRLQDRGSPLARPSGLGGPVSSSLCCLGAIQYSRGSYSARLHRCPWRRDLAGDRPASNDCVSCRSHPRYLHPMHLMLHQMDWPISRPFWVFPSFRSSHEHSQAHIERAYSLPVSFSLYTTATQTRRQQQERQPPPQQYRRRHLWPVRRCPSLSRRVTQGVL